VSVRCYQSCCSSRRPRSHSAAAVLSLRNTKSRRRVLLSGDNLASFAATRWKARIAAVTRVLTRYVLTIYSQFITYQHYSFVHSPDRINRKVLQKFDYSIFRDRKHSIWFWHFIYSDFCNKGAEINVTLWHWYTAVLLTFSKWCRFPHLQELWLSSGHWEERL